MLRMVVAPFRSCRKMHSLKTSQHDYQAAFYEVIWLDGSELNKEPLKREARDNDLTAYGAK
jgi:hypothetical protein